MGAIQLEAGIDTVRVGGRSGSGDATAVCRAPLLLGYHPPGAVLDAPCHRTKPGNNGGGV